MIAAFSTRRGFAALVLIVAAVTGSAAAHAQPPVAAPPAPAAPVLPAEEHPVERLRQARLLRSEPPDFPEAALRRGIVEESVFLQLLIDLRGRVKHPHVLQCPHAGLGFEAAAVKAVKRWRYEPAELNGERIEAFQTVEVKFDAATSRPSSAMLVSAP